MVGNGDTRMTMSYIGNLVERTLFLFDGMGPGVYVFTVYVEYIDRSVIITEVFVDTMYRLLSTKRPVLSVPVTVARPVVYLSDLAAFVLRIDFPIPTVRIETFCTPTHFGASLIRRLLFSQPVANERDLAKTIRWHVERRH